MSTFQVPCIKWSTACATRTHKHAHMAATAAAAATTTNDAMIMSPCTTRPNGDAAWRRIYAAYRGSPHIAPTERACIQETFFPGDCTLGIRRKPGSKGGPLDPIAYFKARMSQLLGAPAAMVTLALDEAKRRASVTELAPAQYASTEDPSGLRGLLLPGSHVSKAGKIMFDGLAREDDPKMSIVCTWPHDRFDQDGGIIPGPDTRATVKIATKGTRRPSGKAGDGKAGDGKADDGYNADTGSVLIAIPWKPQKIRTLFSALSLARHWKDATQTWKTVLAAFEAEARHPSLATMGQIDDVADAMLDMLVSTMEKLTTCTAAKLPKLPQASHGGPMGAKEEKKKRKKATKKASKKREKDPEIKGHGKRTKKTKRTKVPPGTTGNEPTWEDKLAAMAKKSKRAAARKKSRIEELRSSANKDISRSNAKTARTREEMSFSSALRDL